MKLPFLTDDEIQSLGDETGGVATMSIEDKQAVLETQFRDLAPLVEYKSETNQFRVQIELEVGDYEFLIDASKDVLAEADAILDNLVVELGL